jgi:hypothetical protein
MSVYLVTWELNKEKPNYGAARTRFLANLDGYESIKDAGLDSVRFISTSWSAHQVADDLLTTLDKNDRLVVTKLTSGDHQGWLAQDVWDWINARL